MRYGFKETVASILRNAIDDIEKEKAKTKANINVKHKKSPFSEKQYDNQESYEKFLDEIGCSDLEDLLDKMKALLSKLEK